MNESSLARFGEFGTPPRRIVCLTEETVETLYLLGEDERIVGVSGFACRPKEARHKPHVSAFTSAKIDKILDLKPDLVIGFSNLQADIARDLIRAGLNTLVFNQRSVAEIFQMILTLARIVGAEPAGLKLVTELRGGLDRVAQSARRFSHRPRVYFEEWMDPIISGIRWVEELVEIAGGEPIFPEFRYEHDATRRVVNPGEVVAAQPDVIIASWCGRKVNKAAIRSRVGWEAIPAVKNRHIYEIKSTYILQPGPAALTEGVPQLHTILARVADLKPLAGLCPSERMDTELASPHRERGGPMKRVHVPVSLGSHPLRNQRKEKTHEHNHQRR
ncbi:MAG TPA: cobalamin-binding protein [Candidatus Binatia bacterium]|jgi:iron complex transport system substrate-binding protein|nr:cobalamin-binding protein [Candidatus Binatia bacterium]